MKIALTGFLHPFGPNAFYGGERQIWYLAQALVQLGHEVTVFAIRGCDLPGCRYVIVDHAWRDDCDVYYEAISAHEEKHGPFDFINSFQAWGRIDARLRAKPCCLEVFFVYHRLRDNLLCPSRFLNHLNGGTGTVIYYGLPEEPYGEPVPHDGYLAWMGRFVREKAPHLAIEVARRAGKRLLLMGVPQDYQYFVNEVWPRIDGDKVVWLRGVDDDMKRRVLRRAEGFVSTNWNGWGELFGIVNIESLANGVPVIGWCCRTNPSAMNFGGGEIIEHGVQGFINEYVAYNGAEMERAIDNSVSYLRQLGGINRSSCYRLFKKRFTAKIMADNHVKYYDIVRRRGRVQDVTAEVHEPFHDGRPDRRQRLLAP